MTRKLAEQRRKDLDQAGDYRSWREIALELDRLEGAGSFCALDLRALGPMLPS